MPPLDPPAAAPAVIPLGVTHRVHLPGRYLPPAAVAARGDLPPFFCLGLVAPETFRLDADGWRVRYAHPAEPDTWLDVAYARGAGALRVRARWCGIDGAPGEAQPEVRNPGEGGWAALTGAVFPGGPPPAWHALQQRRVEGAYTVRVLPRPTYWRYTYLPSGVLQRVVCLAPLARLRAAADVLDAIGADPAVLSTVAATLVLGGSVVNYVAGHCPDGPRDEEAAVLRARHETGFVPPAAPAWEVNADGVRALTVPRRHYYLDVGCAFADTERVVAHLHAAGFVGAVGAPDPGPGSVHAPENGALLIPDGTASRWAAQCFDAGRTRRVTHPGFAERAGGPALVDRPQVDTLIARAVAVARDEWHALAGRRAAPSHSLPSTDGGPR